MTHCNALPLPSVVAPVTLRPLSCFHRSVAQSIPSDAHTSESHDATGSGPFHHPSALLWAYLPSRGHVSVPCQLPGKRQRLSQEAKIKLKASVHCGGPSAGGGGRQPEGSLQKTGGLRTAGRRRKAGGWEGSAVRSLGTDSGHGALGIAETARLPQSLWVSMAIRE